MDLAQAWTDNAAEYHDTAASLTRKVARIAFDNVVEELPKHGATIVDVACGTGALANIAAEKFDATSGTRIIACDFAPGMVKMVAENAAAHQWDHVKCEVMNGEVIQPSTWIDRMLSLIKDAAPLRANQAYVILYCEVVTSMEHQCQTQGIDSAMGLKASDYDLGLSIAVLMPCVILPFTMSCQIERGGIFPHLFNVLLISAGTDFGRRVLSGSLLYCGSHLHAGWHQGKGLF